MLKSSGSRHSMSRTSRPRDMISLVIPSVGDNSLDGDSIYDIDGHFQSLPLEKPCVIATDSDVWEHEDD
jgi:hypothetical protein